MVFLDTTKKSVETVRDFQADLEALTLSKNSHYIRKYVHFINPRMNGKKFPDSDRHHILPKAKDFFPEFKDLKTNAWNVTHLSQREHYLAHYLLAKAFPGSSMSLAFYYMTNILKRKHSRVYEEAKKHHLKKLREMTQDPVRNAKISKALSNRPKSESHRNNLRGKRPNWHGEKISEGMMKSGRRFWKDDKERVAKHSEKRKNKPTHPWTEEQKQNMSRIKTGHPASDETRAKMAKTREGRKWFTNGVLNTMGIAPIDNSWTLGRTKNW